MPIILIIKAVGVTTKKNIIPIISGDTIFPISKPNLNQSLFKGRRNLEFDIPKIRKINETNKNDVVKLIGFPHSKSIDNENEWIYIERVFVKGEFHKLGQNVLKSNNILFISSLNKSVLAS